MGPHPVLKILGTATVVGGYSIINLLRIAAYVLQKRIRKLGRERFGLGEKPLTTRSHPNLHF